MAGCPIPEVLKKSSTSRRMPQTASFSVIQESRRLRSATSAQLLFQSFLQRCGFYMEFLGEIAEHFRRRLSATADKVERIFVDPAVPVRDLPDIRLVLHAMKKNFFQQTFK